MTDAPIAFIWGDDSYAIDAAIETMRARIELFPAGPPDRWRIDVDTAAPGRSIGLLQERLQTGVMFGSGTLAVVGSVAPLARRAEDRAGLISAMSLIAPGNGLVFAEETESGRREPPHRALVEAVRAAGGREIPVRAPKAGELTSWIEARARERNVTLGQGTARELAARIGGFVTEADAERRQQGRLAVMSLDKLALLRLNGEPITVDDVRALVVEAVPSSVWAFVDAVGTRNAARAIELAERLLDSQPEPVVYVALHRRLRELIEILDRLRGGERPQDLPRSMKLNPYRAEQLLRQASAWSIPELETALEGLLDLDAMLKGMPGLPAGDAQRRLAFVRWLGELVARPA